MEYSYSPLTIQHVSLDYFLAGAGASGGKFTSAEKNNAIVINLDRLQRVLLGRITLKELHEMDKLDSKSLALAAQRQEEEKQDALRRQFPPLPMPIVSKPPRNQSVAKVVQRQLPPPPSASQLEFLRQSCIQR